LARAPSRTRRQSLGEWLAAENRRRGGLARLWPRRVAYLACGLTIWAAAIVLAAIVAMQPIDYGLKIQPAEPGLWEIVQVTPGGPAWRAGLGAGEQISWNGVGADRQRCQVNLEMRQDRG